MRGRRGPVFEGSLLLGVAAAALVFGVRALAPFGASFHDHLTPNLQDPVFNLYLMRWGARQIEHGLPHYWSAGFFHPEPDVVGLSDHMLGPALATWTFGRLGLGAVASYNLLLLLSFPLAAASLLLLLRRAGASPPGAVLGALAFAFAPYRWLHLEHLPMLWVPALALAIWAWDRLLEKPTPGRGATFLLFYAAHVSGGGYWGLMIHLPIAAVAAVRARTWLSALRGTRTRWTLIGTAAASVLPAYLSFAPYLASAARGYARTEGDMAVWGATLASFLTPSRLSRYFPEALADFYRFENALFPGLLVTLAGVFLLVRWTRRRRAEFHYARRPVLLGAGIGVVLVALALGDYATWTGREHLSIAGFDLRVRGYSRPALLLALGAVVAAVGWGRRPRLPEAARPGLLRRALFLQSAVALSLCLPMIAAPASRFVPGLLSIRAPARFAGLALLGGALLVAAAVTFTARRLPRRWRTPAVLGLGLVFLLPELLPRSVPWHRIDRPEEFPAVYRELAHRGLEGPVAELPFARGDLRSDLIRMWHSTLHWNPTSAGYSGYEPATARELRAAAERESGQQVLVRLRGLGFRFAIVHEHELEESDAERAARELPAALEASGGRELWSDGRDRLFDLGTGPGGKR